jgi:hypothetical protein
MESVPAKAGHPGPGPSKSSSPRRRGSSRMSQNPSALPATRASTESFLLLAQEKGRKRRAPLTPCPLRGFPALLGTPGAAQLNLRSRCALRDSNNARLNPAVPAVLGCGVRGAEHQPTPEIVRGSQPRPFCFSPSSHRFRACPREGGGGDPVSRHPREGGDLVERAETLPRFPLSGRALTNGPLIPSCSGLSSGQAFACLEGFGTRNSVA